MQSIRILTRQEGPRAHVTSVNADRSNSLTRQEGPKVHFLGFSRSRTNSFKTSNQFKLAAMVGLPFLARMRSSGRRTAPKRRPIASITQHLINKLAERAKETFGSTSVPETPLARHDGATTQFKLKKFRKGKGLVWKAKSITSEVPDETPDLTLMAASITSEVPDETLVQGKVDFVRKQLKGNVAKEFVSKDSELTYTRTISAAQYVQRQFELGSIMQLVVITLTMVVCFIRAAKCCRTLMTRISSGKQTYEKATNYDGDDAMDKTWKFVQMKPPESSARPFLSGEKGLKVAVTSAPKVFGETYRNQEDASTRGLIGSSVWTSIESEEIMKEDDQHPILPGMESVNDIPYVLPLVTEGANENECFDQAEATSLGSEEGIKEDDQGPVSLGLESVNDIPYVLSLVTEGANENECFDQEATSLGSEEGIKEDDQGPVSLGLESVNDIPYVPSLVTEGDNENELGVESVTDNPYVPSLVTEDDNENESFDQQATSLVSKWIKANPEEPDSPDRKQEEQGTLNTLGVSQQITVNKGTEEGSDATPVSLETISAVEASPTSLWRDSWLGREQEEIEFTHVLGSLQSKLDDDGEEEEKKEDFESKSLHLVMGGAKQEQPLFVIADWSPRAPDDKDPVEVSDPEQIFSESTPAMQKNQNPLLRDCPSLASATSTNSSITSDGDMTNDTGGSSISSGSPGRSVTSDGDRKIYTGDTSMSPGSPGRSVRRISFCPSPPQVRVYERYDMDREDPSSASSDPLIQFTNLNKKRRMLKKNLDELNRDGMKLAVPVQGTQRVTRMAKQLGQAVLMVSASVLTQRR
jgi:hypothetical protein